MWTLLGNSGIVVGDGGWQQAKEKQKPFLRKSKA
jgi:hypothetical protein